MKWIRTLSLGSATAVAAMRLAALPPTSAQQKPNIIVIMGDDIGMWNIGAYHRGMMAGRTPNLDKLAAVHRLLPTILPHREPICPAGLNQTWLVWCSA